MSKNQHLKIGYVQADDPPWVYPCFVEKQAGCSYPGIYGEMWRALGAYLNITAEFVQFAEYGGYEPVAGSRFFDGVLGGVQNGTVDVTLIPYSMRPSRFSHFTYSHPFSIYITGFVIGITLTNRRYDLKVFTAEALVKFFCFVFIIGLIRSLKYRDLGYVWRTFSLLIDKHLSARRSFSTCLHLVAISLFSCAYYGSFRSQTIAGVRTVRNQNLWDFLEDPDSYIIADSIGAFKDVQLEILDRYRQVDRMRFSDSYAGIIERLCSGDRAAYFSPGRAQLFMSARLKPTCQLMLLDSNPICPTLSFTGYMALVFRQSVNETFLEYVNQILDTVFSQDTTESYWQRRYLWKYAPIDNETRDVEKLNSNDWAPAMTFQQFFDGLVYYFYGVAVSFVFFILEHFHARFLSACEFRFVDNFSFRLPFL